MIKLKTKIGNSLLELEFNGQQEMIAKGAFWTQLPVKCGCCNSSNLGLFSRTTKDGDDYYGLKCLACSAELLFHQYKKGGFYLTKEDEFSIYKPKIKSVSIDEEGDVTEDQDIPF